MVEENVTFDKVASVQALKKHYTEVTSETHLRDLLQDEARNEALRFKFGDNVWLDFSHTKIDAEGLKLLLDVAAEQNVAGKTKDMFSGAILNTTEKRMVRHHKLRTQSNEDDIDKDVIAVREQIKDFSTRVRDGTYQGHTGKKIRNIVAIGIGGSYLGPEFVYEALRYEKTSQEAAGERRIKFLANVDPIDFERALDGVDVDETLFVIVSKTFTTAETMLNARTARNFIREYYTKAGNEGSALDDAVRAHMCAVSTNLTATEAFGIDSKNVFGFWDWVGGRFSVSSAVGLLPLSLFFGFDILDQFLKGLASVDAHFQTAELTKNAPAMIGLIGFYNTYIAGIESRTILPYCQALLRFPAHIQQLDMESNGKTVSRDGVRFDEGIQAGPIIFGEPGTNGQHSFYQLMHQGRVISAEFIGFAKSQTPKDFEGEVVSNHDELMSNFFAQPDALALGKTYGQLSAEGVPEELQPHKLFSGDRTSFSILFGGQLDPTTCGQLLAFYEHRVAVEGFIYDINSFDQWGVELGKVLAKDVRSVFSAQKKSGATNSEGADLSKFNPATQNLLKAYLDSKN